MNQLPTGKKSARKWFAERPPLAPNCLSDLVRQAEQLLRTSDEMAEATGELVTELKEAPPSPEREAGLQDFRRQLLAAYLTMLRAETDALVVLDETHAGRRRTKCRQLRRDYRNLRDEGWTVLGCVGRSYAAKCPLFQFARAVDGLWGPLLEQDGEGRLLYRNTFKCRPRKLQLAPDLAERYQPPGPDEDAVDPAAVYRAELHEYLSQGGRMVDLVPLRSRLLKRMEAGDRYEYVLRDDEQLIVCRVTKDIGFTPGHSLLAEGTVDFHDRPVLSAGEFWVMDDAQTVIFNVGSGHYVPYFDALTHVRRVVARLDDRIKRDFHFVAYGGPASARKASRQLGEALGQTREEATAALPRRVWERRVALHCDAAPGDLLRR